MRPNVMWALVDADGLIVRCSIHGYAVMYYGFFATKKEAMASKTLRSWKAVRVRIAEDSRHGGEE